jgi:aerobic-type carbon monoxide dehydrogenase small subunit (CoxS/CutS family)
MKTRAITLFVNDEELNLNVPAHHTLLQVLRANGFTGTKYGCGTGECGACTVLLDGEVSMLACLSLAALMDGKRITTIAGLEKDNELHPVQEAFVEKHAVQCGYCTPGMILKSVSILNKNPEPTDTEIREELEGNICRCTGYVKIVDAVKHAGKLIKEKQAVK